MLIVQEVTYIYIDMGKGCQGLSGKLYSPMACAGVPEGDSLGGFPEGITWWDSLGDFLREMYSFMNQVAVRAVAAKLWEIKDTYNTKVFA